MAHDRPGTDNPGTDKPREGRLQIESNADPEYSERSLNLDLDHNTKKRATARLCQCSERSRSTVGPWHKQNDQDSCAVCDAVTADPHRHIPLHHRTLTEPQMLG